MRPTLYHTVAKKRLQRVQCGAIDTWILNQMNVGTIGSFQHPLRDLQGPRTLPRLQATADSRLPTPAASFVDPNRAAIPRMPTVMNFPRISAMGIVLMSCTITAAVTCRWRKMRPSHVPYNGPNREG